MTDSDFLPTIHPGAWVDITFRLAVAPRVARPAPPEEAEEQGDENSKEQE